MKHRTLKIAFSLFLLAAVALAQDVTSFEKRVTVKQLSKWSHHCRVRAARSPRLFLLYLCGRWFG